jgi:hypothetical protein
MEFCLGHADEHAEIENSVGQVPLKRWEKCRGCGILAGSKMLVRHAAELPRLPSTGRALDTSMNNYRYNSQSPTVRRPPFGRK